MASYSSFTFQDLFTINSVNLDQLTETYSISFYGDYLLRWPDYQYTAHHPSGMCMSYIIGKSEGEGTLDNNNNNNNNNNKNNNINTLRHGHVSALATSPIYRRIGLGKTLMEKLENISNNNYHSCYFVDLFVRKGNKVAVAMYEGLGYSIYRTVLGYYSGGGRRVNNNNNIININNTNEDALDMRKALVLDREEGE
eukprot:Tbor_TRINITY_DN5475_c1_g6::TRINITY_DN5475_c1_g6_i2::g.24425::m.24425/K17972/NAA20, NAT3; N-terminal acetyltransferase B complex catalytic subunit